MNGMKNVNNTDLNISHAIEHTSLPADERPVMAGYDSTTISLIELMFFAYRDFVAAPDEILARQGFGRAHHRVLHFVNRHPGMPVARLLEILKITKQSLARVLRDLVDEGFITQKEGPKDRRQRLLYTTPKGEELALTLAHIQSQRVASALSDAGPDTARHAERVLFAMIDPDDRGAVARFMGYASAEPEQDELA